MARHGIGSAYAGTDRALGIPRVLLVCGAMSSVLYIAMLVFIPIGWSSSGVKR